ncbi:hypothetical protein MNV49_000946 [Pseudohyphozyma bogoriensis]|nr:hypothetical protein MNV49_000946 [Pseudohyphozyma bogoriensis]
MLRIPRVALPKDQFIGTSTTSFVRHYAAAPSKGGKAPAKAKNQPQRGSRGLEQADARIDVIKKFLFESSPSDADRLASLAKVVPSVEVHETITRAWALHERHQREAHEAELKRKYDAMKNAIDVLEQTDRDVWEKAVGGKKYQNVDQKRSTNARLEGLFPRELRVPLEKAGDKAWDSQWTRVSKD